MPRLFTGLELPDDLAAALTGKKTPEKALADAQAEIDRILKPYR